MPAEVQPIKFTEAEKTAFKAAYAPKATPDQFALFINECERRALIPNTHVVFQIRSSKDYDPATGNYVYGPKVTMITTINAARLLMDRYSRRNPEQAFGGLGHFKWHYGQEGTEEFKVSEIPLARIPHACTVTISRKDWKEPLLVVARFDAYAQHTRDGKLTDTWERRGPEQLAKCVEVAAYRAAAPEELGGLYLSLIHI